MDRSLWLLLFLRTRAGVRRWLRGMRGAKGIALAVIGALVFAPMLLGSLFAPRTQGMSLAHVRQFGPLMLFGFCVVNVLFSTGERMLYYAPAEVDFLFTGPYRPRQLLLFKVIRVALGAIFTAGFMALIFNQHATLRLAAFVGAFLTLQLIYLFALACGLIFGTAGTVVQGRVRVVVIALIVLGAGLVAWSIRREIRSLPPAQVLERVVHFPALAIAALPFRPFVMAFTAERLWPDLAVWALAAGLIDVSLLGLVLALNAQFLEASAAASSRIYARIQKLRQGGPAVEPRLLRFTLPDFPYLSGVGPNLWRQLLTVLRTPAQLVGVLVIYLMPLSMVFFAEPGVGAGAGTPATLVPTLAAWSTLLLIAPSMVAYDFRADLERMEDLKTLPMPSWCLVLGEVLAPVILLTGLSWLVLAALGLMKGAGEGVLPAAGALVVPLNFLLIAIENLYFLWFPYRVVAINAFDVQALGRQMVLFTAKLLSLGVVVGLAVGVWVGAFYLLGAGLLLCTMLAWVVSSACAVALVPLLALAFDRLDVSADRPE